MDLNPTIWSTPAGWTIDRIFIEKPREEWEREISSFITGQIINVNGGYAM